MLKGSLWTQQISLSKSLLIYKLDEYFLVWPRITVLSQRFLINKYAHVPFIWVLKPRDSNTKTINVIESLKLTHFII